MPDFIYIIHPPRPSFAEDSTEEERQTVGAHFAYLQKKLADGELILVGRTQDTPPMGICVFEAPDMEAAERFFREDPAVAAGIFTGEVRPYHVALMRGRD